MDSHKISMFDQVRLLSTKNVSYLSNPSSAPASPKGIWSVAAAIDNELLLVKGNVVIRVPVADVLKIAEYDISRLVSQLGKLSHGEITKRKTSTSNSNEFIDTHAGNQ